MRTVSFGYGEIKYKTNKEIILKISDYDNKTFEKQVKISKYKKTIFGFMLSTNKRYYKKIKIKI